MMLTKDGNVLELTNVNHVAAYLSSGWEEVKEGAQKPSPKAETKPKKASK